MRYTVRWLYVLKVAVVLAVVAAAVAGVHHWQVGKQQGAFLAQADRAREAGDPASEVSLLQRYLVVRPDDTDARVRLARLRAAAARTRDQRLAAMEVLDDAIRNAPPDDALLRFAVETYMAPEFGLYDQARVHLGTLIDRNPADGRLEDQYAQCLIAARKFPEAADRLGKAVKKTPGLVEAYTRLVAVLQVDEGSLAKDKTDAVVAEMLAKNPAQAPAGAKEWGQKEKEAGVKAALAAVRYWRQAGPRGQPAEVAAKKVAEAQKLKTGVTVTVGRAIGQLVRDARDLAPDDLDVLLAAARDAYDQAQEAVAAREPAAKTDAMKEARKLLERAVEKHPKEARAYLAAAALEADDRNPAEAAKIARQGVDAIPGSTQLLAALAGYQVQDGKPAEAEQTLGRLQAAGYPDAKLTFLRAQARAAREEWEEAAALLGGLAAKYQRELADDPAFARQVQFAHARALEQLGEQDRRLAAARRAVPADPADPLWVPAQVAVAEALAAAGKADEALAAFRRVQDRARGVWLGIARLELARALRAPPDKRDWAAAADAVARAAQALPDAPEVGVLRVALFDYRDGPAAGRKALDELLAKHPKDPAVWAAAAQQDLREGDPARAGQTLDRAAAAGVKDGVDLRLARAQVLAAAKTPNLAAELGKLADAPGELSKPQQRRLLRGLAELASAAGAAGAAGLWDRAAAADPRNLGLQLARFDLAVRAGDEKALDRVVADIGKADGEDGKPGQTARLVTALRAVWRAQKKGDPSGLADAQEKLEGLEKERPDWARVEFALAVVYDLQRKSDEALAKYRDAVEDGETTPDAARRLAELLFARGRMTEAEAAVRRLPEGYTGGGMLLEKMRTQFLLGKDPKAALAAAEKVVRPTSTGYEDQMWLGQVAWAAKDPAKAEAALRRAAALKPDQTGPWLTLVRVLAATGRRDEAARVAAEAEGKVAPAERGLFGALAAAALGKTEEAVGRFGKARGERPDDLRTLQAEAEYLFSIGRLKEAREAFRRVLGLPKASAEEKVFATRMLAAGLAADPDPATAREALRVLGLWDEKTGRVKDLAPTAPAADRRAAAGALALQKDRDSKLKAITLLEAVGLTALDPAELFLLAQVYQEVAGPTHKLNVRTAMAELLRRSDAVPLYVGYYAGWLLKEKDPAAAARWVGRYAELQPGTPLATELQARLAAAEGKKDEAARALRAGADRPDAPLGLLARIAEDIGLPDEAEGLYRRAADRGRAATPPRPAAALPLAAFLGRRGKTGPAVDLLGEVRAAGVPASGRPDAAWGPTAIAVLGAAKDPPAADAARVAGWLEEALKAAGPPDKPALAQYLASVKNFQGQYPAAIALYRQAVAANPRDVIALNNLAYLESVDGRRHDDALRLIEQAKGVAGPHPDLVDTEAVIRLGMNQPDEAAKLMRVVTTQAPTGTAYFHLAQAELAAGRRTDARQAWKDARAAGLNPADLHPLERPAHDKLAAELK